MANFIESPRFPDWMSWWAKGGRGWMTIVAETYGGNEFRNAQWQIGRGKWDIADAFSSINPASAYAYTAIRDLFNVGFGQLNGFRFKDFKDFKDEGNGIMGQTGIGTGVPSYQLYKKTTLGGVTGLQIVNKPVSPTVVLKRNGGTVTPTFSYTTGIVTFAADASQLISTITIGNPTVVHIASTLTGASNGKLVYLTGITGTVGTLLNNIAWTISSGGGSTALSISVDSTGYVYSSGGTAAMYPQASDTLTWTGEYDIPVRFGSDDPNMGPDQSTGADYSWQSLAIIEIRNP